MTKKHGLVDEISEKLCNEFQLVIPLHPKKLKAGKKTSDQDVRQDSEASLQKFYQLAHEERLRHHLGLIARARVAFGLQQRLLQQGYSVPLVKEVLLSMLASVFVGKRS